MGDYLTARQLLADLRKFCAVTALIGGWAWLVYVVWGGPIQ